MRNPLRRYLLVLGLMLGLTGTAAAEERHRITFTVIDFPGALATLATDISAAGDIVGRYCLNTSCLRDVTGNWHGFLLSDGEFTSIDFPGAFHTNAVGINDSGYIVGRYRDVIGGPFHGFLLTGGKFTSIMFREPSPPGPTDYPRRRNHRRRLLHRSRVHKTGHWALARFLAKRRRVYHV